MPLTFRSPLQYRTPMLGAAGMIPSLGSGPWMYPEILIGMIGCLNVCLSIITKCFWYLTGNLVYRVHWFRSKALRDRWKEEVEMLQCEAEWTRNYFQSRLNFWSDRQQTALRSDEIGIAYYAAQQRQIYHWLYSI